jgi:hypothetical protein
MFLGSLCDTLPTASPASCVSPQGLHRPEQRALPPELMSAWKGSPRSVCQVSCVTFRTPLLSVMQCPHLLSDTESPGLSGVYPKPSSKVPHLCTDSLDHIAPAWLGPNSHRRKTGLSLGPQLPGHTQDMWFPPEIVWGSCKKKN